jgi:hypothetical protein
LDAEGLKGGHLGEGTHQEGQGLADGRGGYGGTDFT